MTSPDCKSAAKRDSCSKQKLPSLHVIFPWKRRPAISPQLPLSRDDARNAQVKGDGVDRDPTPISPDRAKVRLIDKIRPAIHPRESIETVEQKTLTPGDLHRLYAGTSVPEHRYLAPSLNDAVNSPELAPHPAKWLAGVSGIDLSKVVNAWLNTNRSTEFEQLYCIGLDPETVQLTGVLTVKQGNGYSGKPCTAGSREYVAFWVDWGYGFRYEGTASVAVYDFGWLPPAGLEYNVSLSVDLLSRMRSRRESPNTVKVRAVLSWGTPSSTADPNAPVVWGNSLESRIPIPPSQAAREANQVPCLATAGATEIHQNSTDGRIVDAAIKALTSMAFGPHAGLTVVPQNANASSGATDRSFTIDARDIEDSGNPFALYVSNRPNVNRDAVSSFNQTLPAAAQESEGIE